MVAHFVQNINSYLPGGWERTLPYGVRLVIGNRRLHIVRSEGEKAAKREPDAATPLAFTKRR